MEGFAGFRLLKQRHKRTRKWPIELALHVSLEKALRLTVTVVISQALYLTCRGLEWVKEICVSPLIGIEPMTSPAS